MRAGLFSGVITAIATPFTANGESVDESSLLSLLDFQLKAGVDGIVACGSTGESPTLSPLEYETVVMRARERVPPNRTCMAGISVSSTTKAVEMGLVSKRCGVDALLVATPPYNKPSQLGIMRHFDAIREKTGLPIVAYDIPGRSGVGITAATLGELAKQETISGLKDATGSLDHVLDVLAEAPASFSVLSGEDSLTLATLACGGTGVISAAANFVPERFVALLSAWKAGETQKAAELQISLLPFIRLAFSETNPVPVKAALALLGIIKSGEVRLPLVGAGENTVNRLRKVLGV